jgi:hypothetical protein
MLIREYCHLKVSFCAVIHSDVFICVQEAEESPQTYISFVYTISTLIAVYGLAMVFEQSKIWLQNIHIRAKFFCLQTVLMIIGVQRPIISLVVMFDGIVCVPPLHAKAVADRMYQWARLINESINE